MKENGTLDAREDLTLNINLSRDSGAYQRRFLGAAAEEDAKSLACNRNKHSSIGEAPERGYLDNKYKVQRPTHQHIIHLPIIWKPVFLGELKHQAVVRADTRESLQGDYAEAGASFTRPERSRSKGWGGCFYPYGVVQLPLPYRKTCAFSIRSGRIA